MRLFLKKISHPFLKFGLQFYYSKPRNYRYQDICVKIHPDVFPPQLTLSTKILLDFVNDLNSPYIEMKNSANYNDLPSILAGYHIGVILYNGSIPNYVINAPNKLFEYLACGLDVIFPAEVKGCYPYITVGTYPKVTMLDFKNLEDLAVSKLLENRGQIKESVYFAEKVLHSLASVLEGSGESKHKRKAERN